MKKNKEDAIGTSPFDILRSRVILLQTKRPKKDFKTQLDWDRDELQKRCYHENVAELMSAWSPKKTPKAKFIFSSGRVCLDCGLEELVSGMKGHFYRILPEASFFANFSNIRKLKNLLENPIESKLVFRKLGDLLEENLEKEVAKVKL